MATIRIGYFRRYEAADIKGRKFYGADSDLLNPIIGNDGRSPSLPAREKFELEDLWSYMLELIESVFIYHFH